jgi:endo-1,4-beta-xylanase
MTELSRRDCLALTLAASAGALLPDTAAADAAGTAPDSLNGLAAAKGMGFGSCIGGSGGRRTSSFDDPQVRAIMLRECGILVPENELKWVALRPSATAFNFAPADRILDFARDNAMRVRGHTLLWHNMKWFPDWLKTYDFGPRPATEAERLLREHITTVCSRCGTRIFTYDVVNETIDADTGEMRDTVFTRYLGPKVIDIAFDAARKAAPHAKLVYNDYMSWGPGNATHRAGVLRLLERLRASDVPVEVLGVQGHIGPGASDSDVSFNADDEREWRQFLDQVAGLGLDLAVTEFDVGDQTMPSDVAARDAAVADLGRRYLDVMMSYKQLRYVMVWGMVDRYSWLREHVLRADGLLKRPSPYDDNDQPKPLREAIAQSFRAAPAR